MRTKDKEKSLMGKATKTINFDKIVLMKLEERAKKSNSTVSNIVNMLCRKIILTDQAYYKEMAKYYYIKFQEMHYMQEQAQIIISTK